MVGVVVGSGVLMSGNFGVVMGVNSGVKGMLLIVIGWGGIVGVFGLGM